MINKGKLRELVKEVTLLTRRQCFIEARVKIAVAFDEFDTARIMFKLDDVNRLEKEMPRSMQIYRARLTERLLRHIGDAHGPIVSTKLTKALTNE